LKDEGIQWVIDALVDEPVERIDSRNKYQKDSEQADEDIYVCPKCGICWEKNALLEKTFYYEDFPTYRKERKVCPKCDGLVRL